MSDVTVAPNASPPPVSEVPVDPNPTSLPTPVGPQTPDKPVADRAESRRESISKAFEKARSEIKPREARMGDNNPPEPMKREEKKPKDDRPAPIDLKKRPTDQPPPRERSEHGHFAPRATDQRTGNDPQISRSPVKQLPPTEPYREPPQRMTPQAKAEWHATPASVRGDVHRMQAEFGNAYQRFKGDIDTMNQLRPFAEMARQSGTTLDRALSAYTGMEEKLRNDVVGGLDLIINNLNLRAEDGTQQGRKLTLMDVAWHIVNQTPEQRQLLQSRNTAMAQSHQLQQANQRIQQLETLAKTFQYQQAFGQTRGAVDQFAAQHPRLDELGDLIEQEIKLGFDLPTAYRRAEMLRPATAAQTRTNGTAPQTHTTTAQTRTSDRSISGAPSGPSNGQSRPRQPVGRREAIANAIKRAGNSL